MIGVRVIHSRRHGMSVRRDGDKLTWLCRCGQLEHTHPVGEPVDLAALTSHAKWVIW